MKKADLEKHKGKKITGGGFGSKDRYGKGSNTGSGKPEPRLSGATAGLLKGFLEKKKQ
jgi:hypothetical protein